MTKKISKKDIESASEIAPNLDLTPGTFPHPRRFPSSPPQTANGEGSKPERQQNR